MAISSDDVIYLPGDSQRDLWNYGEKPRPYSPQRAKQKYGRKWSPYFLARQKEKQLSMQLLGEVIRILNVKTYGKGAGRPPFPLADKIFLCVQKVLRATTFDANEEFIEYAQLKGLITSRPRPHSVSDFMNDAQLTPILQRLITLTATPVAEFEKRFAIDATGLSTFDRNKWVKVRTEYQQHRKYKKLHTIVGTRTNIIVAAKVTVGSQHDSPILAPLLAQVTEHFKVKEMSADAAYTSRANVQAIVDKGAVPYLAMKKNLTIKAKGCKAWHTMIAKFRKNQESYLAHYHRRSNVETTYAMFKRKINQYLSSKTDIAQTNEALCIAVAHNLFCLVNAVFCDNLEVEFQN